MLLTIPDVYIFNIIQYFYSTILDTVLDILATQTYLIVGQTVNKYGFEYILTLSTLIQAVITKLELLLQLSLTNIV